MNSISDLGVASESSFAGTRGACMNVLINIASINDDIYSEAKKKEVDSIILKAEKLHLKNYDEIMRLIKTQ